MPQRLVFRRAALWEARGGAADVLVEDGRIAAISETPLPVSPGNWDIEANGRLLVPGFVDTHTHLERRLARGLSGADGARGHPQLEEPLRGRFERALNHEDLVAAATLDLAEAALAGTTTVFALCRAPGASTAASISWPPPPPRLGFGRYWPTAARTATARSRWECRRTRASAKPARTIPWCGE
jgi:cytosine/adenosine deaminase-related metal-dependent hydrolase